VVDGVSMTENSVASANVNPVLSEDLRCLYLEVMGIQTWFDPAQKNSSSQLLVQHEEKQSEIIQSFSKPVAQQPVQTPVESADNSITSPVAELAQTQTILTSNLHDIACAIEVCQLCELHTMRKQAISGEGAVDAKLFIIVDAPVSDEACENALFRVEDKQMLESMLRSIGISLSSVYISSLVKCCPSGQRKPQTSEMICCEDHLTAQIKLIQPTAIMVLGEQASRQLLVSQKSLTDLRLRHHQYLNIPVFISYHPGEMFNSSETKRKVWADLLQISKQLI
jgi:uracil-DNA glycosylase